MERMTVENIFFHSQCFKCDHCGVKLRTTNYSVDKTSYGDGKSSTVIFLQIFFFKLFVKFLNFRTPRNFAVIYLKFKQRGQILRYFIQKMLME